MPDLTELASWAQIVAVPVSLIAIVVSVLLYLRGRQKRELTCDFDPVVSPIEIKAGDALGGDIEITYKGQPVQNLFIVRATIKNTGNVPIRKSEVIEPVTFDFGSEAQLVRRPKIVRKHPDNLKANWGFPSETTGEDGEVLLSTKPVRESQAVLDFKLLNPKEEFTTEFVCTGETTIPEPSVRIEGITSLKIGGTSRGFDERWLVMLINSVVILGFGLFLGAALGKWLCPSVFVLLGVVTFVLSIRGIRSKAEFPRPEPYQYGHRRRY